jgi:Ca2+-binding EF-hand superfamily protein
MAARVAAQNARRKAAENRRVELEERKRLREAETEKKLSDWFAKYDSDGDGQMTREEVRQLLCHLEPEHTVTDEQLDLLCHALGEDGLGDKNEVKKCVTRFQAYVTLGPQIDAAFGRFDVDGSGKLEKSELHKLLVEIAGDKSDQGDLDYILKVCDRDGDASLTKAELLPALATWKKLLEDIDPEEISKRPPPKSEKGSGACAIL